MIAMSEQELQDVLEEGQSPDFPALVTAMRERHREDDTVTYTAYIEACALARRLAEALQVTHRGLSLWAGEPEAEAALEYADQLVEE